LRPPNLGAKGDCVTSGGVNDGAGAGRNGYLGALLEDEGRLVLVPVDPEEPWAAFRRMRALMKRSPARPRASVKMFTTPEELPDAEIIAFPRRDRRT